MKIELETAVDQLKSFDDVLILLHHFPDGDTIGCGFALCRTLQSIGKRARVECCDEISSKYGYITSIIENQQFEPKHIVSVDVADAKLLGSLCDVYGERVELCIDHHASNLDYAKETYVDANSAAACEIIYEIILKLGVEIDEKIAAALYTGIATDTGCFKFTNTTAKTHIIAAELIKKGINYGEINRIMFDTKSKSRVMVEQMALNSMEFAHFDRIATIVISQDMLKKSNAEDFELEGITSLPRQIEGVIVGITLRERKDGKYKISVRSHEPVSASKLCSYFGGGGHERAAGCEIDDTLENAKKMLVERATSMLIDNNL